MDEELILQQPTDRRLGTGNTLPPGPPGAENDVVDYESNKPKIDKESNRTTSRSSRRRSPSGSPPRSRRKSPSRGRRSPSPLDNGSRRRRRSPTPPPRRNRFRDYSPDRRRFDGGGRNLRRSPDRRRGGGRDFRYRGRSSSRSRSRSISPRRGGGSRWSPKKKPSSPLPINAPPPPQVTQPPTQYNALPPQLYSNDTYAPTAYNQYAVPPPQQAAGFPPQTPADAYGMQAPAPPVFNAAYPPPPVWTANDGYAQQPWIPTPDPNQIPQIAQQPPPVAAPTAIPPPQIVQQPTVNEPAPVSIESTSKHDAAVAQEAENQRDELKRQRSSYLKKTSLLRKELKMLKDQRKDLHSGGGAPPSPTTKGFIDENEKLQNQIQKKLNTIENVIDMLTGIIGEENLERDDEQYASDKSEKEEPAKKHTKEPTLTQQPVSVGGNSERSRKKKRKNSSTSTGSSTGSSSSSSSTSSSSSSSENEVEEEDDDSSPERLKNKAIESMKAKAKEGLKRELKEEKLFDEKKRFNYVFYDPEMHWCQTCDVFPKTAKDYLNHLHSKEHMDRESIETPWHTDTGNDQFPNYENAPTKRTPIRGLTFFVPASAWFCKLCNNWMGDLHCASTHLKSQLHASKYNAFLEKNPHFEVNWLADRQRVLNERKTLPPPQQITSVSTTAAESTPNKKSKKEEKVKKRKKKSSDKKDKKKKRKRSKKRKKNAATTSTSSESSSSDNEKPNKTKTKSPIVIQSLDNPNPALSIRVAMRKQDLGKSDEDAPSPAPRLHIDATPHPVPPPAITIANNSSAVKVDPAALLANSGRLGKWTEAQDNNAKPAASAPQRTAAEDDKNDDAILQQWNNVQPVISESEKKLLEQLKGKLKNKPHENATTPAGASIRSNNDGSADRRVRDRDRDRDRDRERERDRDRDRERDRDRNDRDRTERRRRSRSPVFGGGGGRGRMRRTRSRSRSRSRGRAASPYGRRRRTRSRSRGRRSRSFERRRRYSRSRTRSRTRSSSRSRIEKPIVRHPEFRPRVPEKDKEREKRSTTETKDKKNADKKSKSSSTSSTAAGGKKLPFIGKMPVFKKQTAGQADGNGADNNMAYVGDSSQQANPAAYVPQRPPAPTAAQIQMAMMEDAYGNAPPFHPDAGMMMDYDELMPDPIQFVNLMGQAPPPPPPPAGDGAAKSAEVTEDEAEDILPPGIDVAESDDCVPRPISDGPIPRKGPLPKDLEEALNIIFPGEKKSDDEDAEEAKKAKSTGETQIIVEEPIMQPEDLAKEGIHMVTIEETSMIGMDEASQMSMNEPLVFNKPASSMATEVVVTTNSNIVTANVSQVVDITSQDATDIDLNAIQPPPPPATTTAAPTPPAAVPTMPAAAAFNGVTTAPAAEESSSDTKHSTEEPDSTPAPAPAPADIPMPAAQTCSEDVANIVYDLDDIPQPPPSPTESEKNRRQEELNDLAMLGIDADDMAAQCM